MKNLDTSLLCLEIKSLGMGYRTLNIATQDSTIRVLEAAPAGDRFLILLSGSSKSLHQAINTIRQVLDGAGVSEIIDWEIVEKINSTVLEGLFSLTQAALSDCLVVAECASVSALVAVAQTLIEEDGLSLIELKIRRAAPGGAYGFFTASSTKAEPAAEKIRTHFQSKMRNGKIDVIDSPSENFRAFFNFSGKS